MSAEPLLAFKAGRSYRREGTNFIDASPTKGAVLLVNEDGLLHFKWKNRASGEIEEVCPLYKTHKSQALNNTHRI